MGISGRFLHVGGGPITVGNDTLPDWAVGCVETRLDIEPDVQPDILASMTDMGDIGGFNFVFSCHALEHLYPHDVPIALAEHYRVLADGGIAITIVPDLTGIEATDEPVYESYSGPITGLDMIYGKASFVADSIYMAHHTGFTEKTLRAAYEQAGFTEISVKPVQCHSIMCMGKKKCQD